MLAHFGIAACKLLYVGDEAKDYYAARDAGALFIGVQTGMLTAGYWSEVGKKLRGNFIKRSLVLTPKTRVREMDLILF